MRVVISKLLLCSLDGVRCTHLNQQPHLIYTIIQKGWTPLLIVADDGYIDIVKLLLQHQVRVEMANGVSSYTFYKCKKSLRL